MPLRPGAAGDDRRLTRPRRQHRRRRAAARRPRRARRAAPPARAPPRRRSRRRGAGARRSARASRAAARPSSRPSTPARRSSLPAPDGAVGTVRRGRPPRPIGSSCRPAPRKRSSMRAAAGALPLDADEVGDARQLDRRAGGREPSRASAPQASGGRGPASAASAPPGRTQTAGRPRPRCPRAETCASARARSSQLTTRRPRRRSRLTR